MKITTTKLAATDTDGTRIRAVDENKNKVIRPWNYSSNDPHAELAAELAGKPVVMVKETVQGYVFETVGD